MGKGKGSFDYWASRVAVSKIIFELKGELHEQVVKDAFRLAGNKLPGLYEFVRAGDPPVMGITKLGNGVTEEMLRRPRREVAPPSIDQSRHFPSALLMWFVQIFKRNTFTTCLSISFLHSLSSKRTAP